MKAKAYHGESRCFVCGPGVLLVWEWGPFKLLACKGLREFFLPLKMCASLCVLASASIAAGMTVSALITSYPSMRAARTRAKTSSAAANRATRESIAASTPDAGQDRQVHVLSVAKPRAGTKRGESASVVTSDDIVSIVNHSLSERQWQDVVIGAAKALGWIVYHTHDSRKSGHGFPDLILIRGDVLVAVELKTMKGRVRPEQVLWLEAFAGVSQVSSMLARPSDWDEIERVLRGEP